MSGRKEYKWDVFISATWAQLRRLIEVLPIPDHIAEQLRRDFESAVTD